MNRKNSILFTIAAFIFLLSNFFATISCAQNLLKTYESYYLRSKNYPFHADLRDREIQGVAHDQKNWYFTWTNKDPNIGYLSKVPLGTNLDDCVLGAITPCPNTNQVIVNMKQFPQLNQFKYWHWGDPDHYRFKNTDYIIVPITGDSSPIIAIFRASNLSLALIGKLTQKTSSNCDGKLKSQGSVGWCAINPNTGNLYTSEDFDYTNCFSPLQIIYSIINGTPLCDDQNEHFSYRREILCYSIPWDLIQPTGFGGNPILDAVGSPQKLLGKDGEFIELYNMQGGEFSPSGELLYISCGSGCCVGQGVGQQYGLDGIYVFNTKDWRLIKRSHNHYYNNNNPSYFDYYYILGCDKCTTCEAGSWSPEGLTIWDLDDNGKDPKINGQLHVLQFHCQLAFGTKSCSDNEVEFEHFGNRLYADPVNGLDRPLPTSLGDDPLPGGIDLPFRTFKYAYNSYPAWDGAEIVLKAGKYPAVGKYSTRIRIVSKEGAAIIR